MEVIIERIPATLQLGLAAFAFSVIVGVPLGILSAVKRGSLPGHERESGCPGGTICPGVLVRTDAGVPVFGALE